MHETDDESVRGVRIHPNKELRVLKRFTDKHWPLSEKVPERQLRLEIQHVRHVQKKSFENVYFG